MRNLLVALVALVLMAAGATAQDTTDTWSDRQLRQRSGYAIDRFENVYDELDRALNHLQRLHYELNRRVIRDSLRSVAGLGLDSVRIEWAATGDPVDTIDLKVGEVSAPISRVAYRNGERVGCFDGCKGVELATYGTTDDGREVVLVADSGEVAAMPKRTYDAAFLSSGSGDGGHPVRLLVYIVVVLAGIGLWAFAVEGKT